MFLYSHEMEMVLVLNIYVPDELLDTAMKYLSAGAGHDELVRLALTAFIHVEAGKRLAILGGSVPDMLEVPRRRMDDEGCD